MRRFRNVFKFLVPGWLYEGEGELVLHTLAMVKDGFMQRAYEGLLARFPTRTVDSALALLGDDRGIPRGRDETTAHYASRLVRWRYPRGHRVRGSAFALLEQVSEYFGGIKAWTIDVKGNFHERDADGSEAYSYGNAWDWDGAGATPAWSRFWIVLDVSNIASETPDYGDPELWGGALGTPGYAVGHVGISPEDANAIRRLMRGQRPWKPAGTRAEWVIVSLDGSAPEPDGTWLHWSRNVAGTQTRTRSAAHRYWSLNPSVNNTYAGNSANFPVASQIAGGSTYAGDPASFTASSTLPDGSTYGGNPASFPGSVRLLDDGNLAV